MSQVTFIKPNANELSTYVVTAVFRDEDDVLVCPVTLAWSLKDLSGAAVNSREDVAITPASTVAVVLSGDDLAVDGYFSGRRVLTFEGTYNSTLANGVPINASCIFDVDRLSGAASSKNTLEDMLGLMSVFCGDPNMETVIPAVRVALLNRAQEKVVPALDGHRLSVLDTAMPGVALDSAGGFDLAQLVNPVFRGDNSIDGIKHVGGYFARRISFEEYRADVNAKRTYTERDPVWYMRAGKAYVLPFTAGDTADIHYPRKPEAMALGATASLNVDCEFGNDVQDVIVELASYWALQFIVKDAKAAEICRINAEAGIAQINGNGPPTDSIRRPESLWMDEGAFRLIVNEYSE